MSMETIHWDAVLANNEDGPDCPGERSAAHGGRSAPILTGSLPNNAHGDPSTNGFASATASLPGAIAVLNPVGGSRDPALGWESAPRERRRTDTRILIVDDCTLYRENLAAIFALHGKPAPSVAWDLPSLVTALHGTEPSVVLLNIETRGSALLLRAAMDISPGVRVIVLGASEDNESEIVACAEAGVAGYHMRTDSLEDLLVLIRKVAGGETLCSPRVSAILLRRLSALGSQRQPAAKELALTTREIQILRMLELGRSNQEIAMQLSIAVHTVKNHVHSLLTKLGVSTRAEAAALSRTIRLHQG
jgi:DNA-binding NarL/FixJ family response regulator